MRVTLFLFQYYQTLPLSAVYLAYALKKEKIDHELKLFPVSDFDKAGRSVQRLASFLADSADIIAVGCFSDMLPYVLIALRQVKNSWPHKKIILGGIGPGAVAEEILGEFDFVDFIVKGPGGNVLPVLIKKIAANQKCFSDLPTVYSREHKACIVAGLHDVISDVPNLNVYDFLGDMTRFDRFLIQTSSGCPYQCTFCYARPAVHRKVVYRDMDDVLNEIRAIKSRKKEPFILRIIDEAFIVNRRRVVEFCDALSKSRLNIEWICYGRVDCVDEELIALMSEAGCREIFYGVESGSDRILTEIKKGFSSREALDAIMMTKRIIPNVFASFICRYPFETLGDFKDTFLALRFLKNESVRIQLRSLVPVKNSEIYLKYKDQLRFSAMEPCDYLCGRRIHDISHEVGQFVLGHPHVFYDYGYYAGKDLPRINEMIKNNPMGISSQTASLW